MTITNDERYIHDLSEIGLSIVSSTFMTVLIFYSQPGFLILATIVICIALLTIYSNLTQLSAQKDTIEFLDNKIIINDNTNTLSSIEYNDIDIINVGANIFVPRYPVRMHTALALIIFMMIPPVYAIACIITAINKITLKVANFKEYNISIFDIYTIHHNGKIYSIASVNSDTNHHIKTKIQNAADKYQFPIKHIFVFLSPTPKARKRRLSP